MNAMSEILGMFLTVLGVIGGIMITVSPLLIYGCVKRMEKAQKEHQSRMEFYIVKIHKNGEELLRRVSAG